MSLISGFEKIVRANEPLAPHTWLQLGGPVEYLAEPNNVDELAALVRRCREDNTPIRVLGGGSNVLVTEQGVKGLVLRLTAPAFSEIVVNEDSLSAGGGAKLSQIISTSTREGLAGLEPLVGIPGTLGGALHGNAGGHGGDVGQWAAHATVMTRGGDIIQRTRGEMVFAYRQSSLDELVILNARFQLERENPEELTKRMQTQWIVKKASQPPGHERTGCIFKNPRGMSADMLIDQSGLKGATVGQAQVSDRHANFIIAADGATSGDVLALINLVRERVLERMGVELELEIEIW